MNNELYFKILNIQTDTQYNGRRKLQKVTIYNICSAAIFDFITFAYLYIDNRYNPVGGG